ncbi:MAG: aldo/keto reductase [Bacteroidota bacterium]|jgi:aryl-alcohol dehydrogenase-like predicted oxidoreductase|nr:aldo/keto reductase [Ignavibacteria bacterium]MCU7500325.1 aldo/keto reductase [Ignavibacteria bacterium]MCU7511676.1 aldo/keto reductase [Ignavibacteria bacterium]MCU7519110.1 aldo/keto reductase [Ignavibacteria bacterium]MCU7525520.1 aldo/keto reductase [Ignavibacteria bacterium]
MKIKKLGRTGLKVSEVCLGTMTFGYQCDETTSFQILDRAYEGGVNFIDTADVYPLPPQLSTVGRTEEIIGNWLKANPGRRHETILATKCNGKMGPGVNDQGLSRRHIMDAIDASLKRLKTDFIDLYQVHFFDGETPLDETLRALDDLVRSGKVHYIGCSNYQAYQLAKALWVSDKLSISRYDSIQPRYNLLFREFENELFPLCKSEEVGVIVYNPLAGGFLTGKHERDKEPEEMGRFKLGDSGKLYQARYWQDAQFDQVDLMKEFFKDRNKSLTQVSLAWVLSHSYVTSAIVGASKSNQLDESLPGVDLSLDEEEMTFLNGLWYNLPRMQDPRVALR